MTRHFLAIAIFLTVPFSALASEWVAGTNGYLMWLGYTDAQLTARVATEDREPFQTAEGTGALEDPFGDVVSRWGETSAIEYPWGDLSSVTVTKNETTQTWDVAFAHGAAVPEKLTDTQKAQWFVYLDSDGDIANNALEGIRVGADAEFSVQYNQEHGWYADFRWYNKTTDFWATNKETKMTFAMDGGTVTLRIPFSEAPETLAPHWRASMGIVEGTAMQIDVVPGVGFPPPKGETYPTGGTADGYAAADNYLVASAAAITLVGYATFQWVAKKRRR